MLESRAAPQSAKPARGRLPREIRLADVLEDELRIGAGAYQPRHRLDLLVPDAELAHKPAFAQQARSVDVASSAVRFEMERAVDAA